MDPAVIDKFAHLTFIDVERTGTIAGIRDLISYPCCEFCSTKFEYRIGSPCKNCRKIVKTPGIAFHFQLVLDVDDIGGLEIDPETFKGFKSTLNLQDELKTDDIEEAEGELNGLFGGKRAKILAYKKMGDTAVGDYPTIDTLELL